ncbi:DUF6232 family protein [Paractinoplanes atraurantiacus]|uniref:Uncharacterized protein n=1 Tax=Paractinoplanes atraurantiacus TaxID=1036182 RepID=A0A285IQD1_9ACTN|nr:DUF6232 family protein [Actinoplanes atraurantiacus]SNY50053.1 hypothetical protein SAMN05421748_110201 [Actinoplanes atraurantiacus]
MAQQSVSPASRPDPEVVYYPGPGIVVTSRRVDTDQGRFLVRDLTHIYREYQETHLPFKIALFCGGVEVALAVPLAAAYGAVSLLAAGVLAAGGTGIAAAIESRSRPSWMALVAEHQGRTVTLYSTNDHQRFNQVRRAVLRAVEAGETPTWPAVTDLTAASGRPALSAASRSHPRRSGRR